MKENGGCFAAGTLEGLWSLVPQAQEHAQGLIDDIRSYKKNGSWQERLKTVKDSFREDPQSHLCSLFELGAADVEFRRIRVNGEKPEERLVVYFPVNEDGNRGFGYLAFSDNPQTNSCPNCVPLDKREA
ncbi:MAG: hypothetical protein ABH816_00790 [Candidatus Levyibacteriota bacterium]